MFEKRSQILKSKKDEEFEDVNDLSRTSNLTLSEAKNSSNKLFETFDSTLEDIRNTEITVGREFDYDNPIKLKSSDSQSTTAKEANNIYFYMSDPCKISKVSGIQFITERYLSKAKEFKRRSSHGNEDRPSELSRTHQSSLEETKETADLDEVEKQLKKLKFEKHMLMLLLGS